MRAIDIARDTLAALEHDGTKPSFHELSKALDAIEAELTDRYVELPVDADGVPLRVGDVVMWDGTGEPFEVKEIKYRKGREDQVGDGTRYGSVLACMCRHHHQPTVEDVLREMCAAYMDTPLDDSNDGEFFAEYAQKLQLRGEGE